MYTLYTQYSTCPIYTICDVYIILDVYDIYYVCTICCWLCITYVWCDKYTIKTVCISCAHCVLWFWLLWAVCACIPAELYVPSMLYVLHTPCELSSFICIVCFATYILCTMWTHLCRVRYICNMYAKYYKCRKRQSYYMCIVSIMRFVYFTYYIWCL